MCVMYYDIQILLRVITKVKVFHVPSHPKLKSKSQYLF